MIVATLLVVLGAAGAQADIDWPQWRGPSADGVAPAGNPPAEWSESKNVRWKVEIPGSGVATPVIRGNRVFVLTAIDTKRKGTARDDGAVPARRPGGRGRGGSRMSTGKPTTVFKFEVLCLNRDDGRVVWRKTAVEEVPHEGHHPSHGFASASPICDGNSLFVPFGSRGLYCFDLDGNLKWKRDLGRLRIKVGFGEGASPALHGDALVVNWDHEGDSFIACLDAETGKDRWRVPRDEGTTWVTPFITEHQGVTQVVVNGSNRARAYDLATGKVLWACGGQTGNPIPTAVRFEDVVYCMSGFRGAAVYAIPLKARGDVTRGDTVAWKNTDTAPYVASPVVVDGRVYFTKGRSGMISCADARTGKLHYEDERLPGIGSLYASLVAAGGKIYVAGREGTTVVLKQGDAFAVLAENRLDEGFDASPAVSGDLLFLRGRSHLYCIGK